MQSSLATRRHRNVVAELFHRTLPSKSLAVPGSKDLPVVPFPRIVRVRASACATNASDDGSQPAFDRTDAFGDRIHATVGCIHATRCYTNLVLRRVNATPRCMNLGWRTVNAIRGPHSCGALLHESRREDSECDRRSHESRTEDSECGRGSSATDPYAHTRGRVPLPPVAPFTP